MVFTYQNKGHMGSRYIIAPCRRTVCRVLEPTGRSRTHGAKGAEPAVAKVVRSWKAWTPVHQRNVELVRKKPKKEREWFSWKAVVVSFLRTWAGVKFPPGLRIFNWGHEFDLLTNEIQCQTPCGCAFEGGSQHLATNRFGLFLFFQGVGLGGLPILIPSILYTCDPQSPMWVNMPLSRDLTWPGIFCGFLLRCDTSCHVLTL